MIQKAAELGILLAFLAYLVFRLVTRYQLRHWLGELGVLLGCGWPIDKALDRIISDSKRLVKASQHMADMVRDGDTLSEAMRVDKVFSRFIPKVRLAEENGDLARVLVGLGPLVMADLGELAIPETEAVDIDHAEGQGPMPHVVKLLLREAIKQGASGITYQPRGEETDVVFAYSDGERKAFDVSYYLKHCCILKLYAGVPYWDKAFQPSSFVAKGQDRLYAITLSSRRTECGESFHLAIAPKTGQ